ALLSADSRAVTDYQALRQKRKTMAIHRPTMPDESAQPGASTPKDDSSRGRSRKVLGASSDARAPARPAPGSAGRGTKSLGAADSTERGGEAADAADGIGWSSSLVQGATTGVGAAAGQAVEGDGDGDSTTRRYAGRAVAG